MISQKQPRSVGECRPVGTGAGVLATKWRHDVAIGVSRWKRAAAESSSPEGTAGRMSFANTCRPFRALVSGALPPLTTGLHPWRQPVVPLGLVRAGWALARSITSRSTTSRSTTSDRWGVRRRVLRSGPSLDAVGLARGASPPVRC